MTYKTAKLNLSAQGIVGSRHWVYQDTGTVLTDMDVATGWVTDAGKKGVEVGDTFEGRDTTTAQTARGYFSIVTDTGATQGTIVLDTG